MNKDPRNNEDINDIKSRAYNEVKSVIDEVNVSNDKYDDLDSDPIFKDERYIKSKKGDEGNQNKTVFQRKTEETRKNAENDVWVDLNWRIKSIAIT